MPQHPLFDLAEPELDAPPAPRERAGRLGSLSVVLLVVGVLAQGIALLLQASYLFAPRAGELVLVIASIAAAVLLTLGAVAAGVAAVRRRDGHRAGGVAIALGAATLVLFAAASWFSWGFLQALSAPV